MDNLSLVNYSDGYHTFDELYTHRNLLFCLAVQHDPLAWKSRIHDDNTMYEGYFIAGTLVQNQEISYHLPDTLWDMCCAKELTKAPPFDGYTSFDVLKRLETALKVRHKEKLCKCI